jgi:three-Cys-motif partner protein
MRPKWNRLVYIDLFAGAGKSRVKESGRVVLGSPLIALEVGGFDRYVFCERSKRCMKALRSRVAAMHPLADVRYVPGDANAKVDEVLEHVPRGAAGDTVLSLCLIDPFNIDGLRLATMRRLADRRVDFMVLVASGMDAARNQEKYLDESCRTIDEVLGRTDWRGDWEAAKGPERRMDKFLTDQFGAAMRELDYKYAGRFETRPVKVPGKGVLLYRLALFSRHDLGREFWSKVRRAIEQPTLFPLH